MRAVGHEMIFASAGSGKTHALTTRFIRLLALGVAPERIGALTFTRKAAGEFFAEIVNRLAHAAREPQAAATLARDVGQPELHTDDFLRLLRMMVRSLHRLSLGTLDGFFARVVRAFPLELGLSGTPSVLDERAAAEEMRRVLGRLFAVRRALTLEQRALIEAFKLATFGNEDKAVAARLDAFIGRHLALYRAAPEASRWGGAARIWPEGFPWGDPRVDPSPAAATLRAWIASAGLKEKQRERWENFVAGAVAWVPGGPLPRELTFVLEKTLAAWADVEAGCAELKFDRQSQRLTPAACAALATLVRRVVALELGRRLAVTQGIGAVLAAFDALYDAEVRRAGRLTFADLQQLLAPGRAARLASADAMSATELPDGDDANGGEATRLLLDYRLDARVDHWMFDEFQDTSFQQWQILENLVDEVVHDASGRRSFFYVGDVKQAIYTWREGDPRLFAYVAARYRQGPAGGVVPRELNDSWRSGPAVIAMVNQVCGDALAMRQLFPQAAEEWNRHWRPHHSARPERGGQAALLFADDEAGRWAATLRVLQEIAPTERGLTCAVLVRTNDTGARLADYLRREGGILAIAEADLHVGADNPVAAALAALLQAAAHPGDKLAQQHVAMSPLGELLHDDALTSADAVSRAVLVAIQADGFEAWIEAWARRLERRLAPADTFSRLRLRQLAAAGQAFDETGIRDVDAFLRFLRDYALREPEGAGVVRVMTVHKSKGLGFDVVVLPDLEGEKLAQRRKGPAVRKAEDRSIEWVLEYPGELIAAHDPVLSEYLREAVAENCYEQLSLLYVALTRAKHALYAVIEPPGKSASLNFPRLLTATLGEGEHEIAVGGAELRGAWSEGDPRWHEAYTAARPALTSEADGCEADWCALALPSRPQLTGRTPSASKTARLDAGQLFAARAGAAVDFGHAVHALLANVEWCDARDLAAVEAIMARWRASARAREGRIPDAAVETARACVTAPELAPVWAQPVAGRDLNGAPRAEVWRERAFEIVLEDAWVTGVFDRVVIERDASGRAVRATVYDFKTDRVDVGGDLVAAASRHAAQVAVYRAAVARLAGLAPAAVSAAVVFTAVQRWVAIGASASE